MVKMAGSEGSKRPGAGRLFRATLAVLALYIFSLISVQQLQIRSLETERTAMLARRDRLSAVLEDLHVERELLGTDAYMERLAREQLGLVKPGEIPYTVASQGR